VVHLLLTTQLTNREIAASVDISKTTVTRYRHIAQEKGYEWAELELLADGAFEAKFNKMPRTLTRRRMPDFAFVHAEMQRPSVTLQLLWDEYRAPDPINALSYSQYTEHYRRFVKSIDRVMRQRHVPGEKLFVDFSGRKPGYTNPNTGEWIPMELFVGVLGASNRTYAACVPRQTISFWIAVHVEMFKFLGGVPRILVPDNLKAAVIRLGADFITNATYAEMAEHYGTVIVPTRTYKPRDKAKVEGGVLIVQRWILARIRNRSFFSASELNAAVLELVRELNERPFKRLEGSRMSRYEEVERAAMLPLPAQHYEFGEWTASLRVDNSYHVLVKGHWYSVPNHLVGQQVLVRFTASTVEVFHNHVRVASHMRCNEPGGLSTVPQHQPDAHRAYGDRTPENFRSWPTKVGPSTTAIVEAQLARSVPALGFPACDSLRKLVQQHGATEVDAASTRAVEIHSLKSVRSLLNTQRHRGRRE